MWSLEPLCQMMILAIKSFWRQKRNLNVRWFIIVIIASANWHFLLGTSALEKLGLRDWIPCVGWMKHGEAAGTGGNESMKGVGIVWVGTGMFTHPILDTWITTPKPIAKSQATGQQLSTGEPRIWLNLQTWFGENKSNDQIMRGQNRYVFLALGYLQHYMA